MQKHSAAPGNPKRAICTVFLFSYNFQFAIFNFHIAIYPSTTEIGVPNAWNFSTTRS